MAPKRHRKPIQLKYSDIAGMRERLLIGQKGLCLICKEHPKIPVLDHHHIKKIKGTGKIRGVLCSNCNVLLAKMENNCARYSVDASRLPEVLRKMAEYLERPQLPYIHPTEAPKKKKLKKSCYKKLITSMKRTGDKRKIPQYPKSGTLTKPLESLFKRYNIKPEFYKK